MTKIAWDALGEHFYETGVDQGVLYVHDGSQYGDAIPWNGLTSVTESPSGGEPTPLYADNLKYLNLLSLEMFGGTIEAYTYPNEFGICDGTATPADGVRIGQQVRKMFGFSYRTKKGNDTEGTALGYKLHIVYGALAAPSEKAYATVNDTPEAITFSWTFTTTAVPVTGHEPTSILTIDSTEVDPAELAELEDLLYGTVSTTGELPSPDQVIAIFTSTVPTLIVPEEPAFVAATGAITIPTQEGVVYRRVDTGATVTGVVTISTPGASLLIRAYPASTAWAFQPWADNDWSFTRDE